MSNNDSITTAVIIWLIIILLIITDCDIKKDINALEYRLESLEQLERQK